MVVRGSLYVVPRNFRNKAFITLFDATWTMLDSSTIDPTLVALLFNGLNKKLTRGAHHASSRQKA